MSQYFHSVRLDEEKCTGCTNCIKRCPTEAIRVRDGKAHIIEVRCIDCGECIRVCPNHAKIAFTDGLAALADFKHVIAIPAPSLFGQFRQEIGVEAILNALRLVGFDDVVEVALGADYITEAYKNYLQHKPQGPIISSSCPAVVRLVQVRFPELIPNLVPIESPMELAAFLAKKEYADRFDICYEEIGVFFITPCPAKVTAIKQPVALEKSYVDGAISISEIYKHIIKYLGEEISHQLQRASGTGIGWARSGGEALAVDAGFNHLSVDGIQNVLSVLEEADMGKFNKVDFVECQACVGGCVGGALTVENPYVARIRIHNMASDLPQDVAFNKDDFDTIFAAGTFRFNEFPEARPILRMDEDIVLAMQKVQEVEKLTEQLPGLDCGACGAPTCRALAEDIVQGQASQTDCIIELRANVKQLAERMLNLAGKLPPAMGRDKMEE